VVLYATAALPQLRSFAQWLTRHAELVRSLTVNVQPDYHIPVVDGLPHDVHLEAAQELLQLALRDASAQQLAAHDLPAAADPAAATAASTAAAAAAISDLQGVRQQQQHQQQQQQWCHQQGLRLHSFSSDLPKAADMLAVLNPHSQADVSLEWNYSSPYVTDSAALSAALSRLSSLQQLRLLDAQDASLGNALTALAQLSQLTSLEISGDLAEPSYQGPGQLKQPVAEALQQLLPQPLPLQVFKLSAWRCQLPALDMAHLTKLTELDVISCVFTQDSVLPAQLQRLTLAVWEDAQGLETVTKLQQLQHLKHLKLHVHFMQQQPLLQLVQLPALQHLALGYDDALFAAATAPAWPLLPQLRELELEHGTAHDDDELPSKQGWSAIRAAIAAATGLTKLCLDPRMRNDDFHALPATQTPLEACEVAACVRLTGLTGLRDLSICSDYSPYARLAPGDALALTALTGLTRLHFWHIVHGVDAAAVTAVARKLTQSWTCTGVGHG
jgi:hypothetical protein